MTWFNTKETVNIQSDDAIKTRWVGLRAFLVTMAALGVAVNTWGIWAHMEMANDLKKQELEIRKAQLDLARRQFQLDSITAAQNQKIR